MRAKTDKEAPHLRGKSCVILDLGKSYVEFRPFLKTLLFFSISGMRRGHSQDPALDLAPDLTPDLALLKNVTEGVVGEGSGWLYSWQICCCFFHPNVKNCTFQLWHFLRYPRIRSRERERDRERYGDRDRYERRSSRERDMEHRRRGRSASPDKNDKPPTEQPPVKKRKEALDPILTRTGGAYIPPAKLRMMQAQITDKSRLVSLFVYLN